MESDRVILSHGFEVQSLTFKLSIKLLSIILVIGLVKVFLHEFGNLVVEGSRFD